MFFAERDLGRILPYQGGGGSMSDTIEQDRVIKDEDEFRETLRVQGWAVLAREAVGSDPVPSLERLGRIVPQYDGRESFEVTYVRGFDDAPYSQSMNGLGAHTEAPGYEPPPRYLALWCHRQARCGKGQTLLADAVRFYDHALSPELRAWADANSVAFVAASAPGSSERRTLRAPIRGWDGEAPLMRFSYNQFRYGNVNPGAAEMMDAPTVPDDPLGRIAEAGEAFFAETMAPVLVPDGCLLVWNNHRLFHGRGGYSDPARHLTRYWLV